MTLPIVELLRATTIQEVSRNGSCREELVPINPDGPQAADTIEELVEALWKIAAGKFNCMPQQYFMAAQSVAEEALAKIGEAA